MKYVVLIEPKLAKETYNKPLSRVYSKRGSAEAYADHVLKQALRGRMSKTPDFDPVAAVKELAGMIRIGEG